NIGRQGRGQPLTLSPVPGATQKWPPVSRRARLPHHCPHSRTCVRLSTGRCVAFGKERNRNLRPRLALPPQFFCERHRLRPDLSIGLPPTKFAGSLTGLAKLSNKSCLLILCKAAGDLPHHDPRRIGCLGEIIARSRNDPHSTLNQHENTKLLSNEIAGKAAGVLHNHRPNAVALYPVEERR